MTKDQIDSVLERVRTWPRQRQEDAVRMLLGMEAADTTPYRLTAEQLKEVTLALAEADRGEFATEEEMKALWKKCGL
jgi:predicted transcriptional regulator